MTERDFCYWLQGYFELRIGGGGIPESVAKMIKKHLDLVFENVTGTQTPVPTPTHGTKDSDFEKLLKDVARNRNVDHNRRIC